MRESYAFASIYSSTRCSLLRTSRPGLRFANVQRLRSHPHYVSRLPTGREVHRCRQRPGRLSRAHEVLSVWPSRRRPHSCLAPGRRAEGCGGVETRLAISIAPAMNSQSCFGAGDAVRRKHSATFPLSRQCVRYEPLKPAVIDQVRQQACCLCAFFDINERWERNGLVATNKHRLTIELLRP